MLIYISCFAPTRFYAPLVEYKYCRVDIFTNKDLDMNDLYFTMVTPDYVLSQYVFSAFTTFPFSKNSSNHSSFR